MPPVSFQSKLVLLSERMLLDLTSESPRSGCALSWLQRIEQSGSFHIPLSFLMCLAPLQPTPVAPGTCARSALRLFL
jgi:hypothetical protein